MAGALSVLPSTVLRNLSDKIYEKRKNAAIEVEGIMKLLASAGNHEKISAVINYLTTVFIYSPQANHRKGGLIGLAAVTIGLTTEAAQYLEQIVPPVINSLSDRDSRVRYYGCEALYNVAKVVRGDLIIFFNQIFDALCKLLADSDPNVQSAAHLVDRLVQDIVTESDQFSIEEFITLLRERMYILNPSVRQFLVGWITVLDSVPDIDMLGFLPDFLDGLFNMLSDSSHEIRQQADSALSKFLQDIKNSPSVDYRRMAAILAQRAASPDEFIRLTAVTWINEFVKLGGDLLFPYYTDILGAILPCISDKEERIRVVAHKASEELLAIKADPAEGFDVGAVLSIARRQLSSEWEATRIEAMHWISTLLNRYPTEPIANNAENNETQSMVESHEFAMDIELDSNVDLRTQRWRSGWTQQVSLEWIFVIINFILELPSTVLDQLPSEHKPQYALFSMLISFAAFVICIIELIYKGRKEKVCWRWRGMLPWFFYPEQNDKPFGSFRDIFGSVCAFCQCIVTAVNYSQSDRPIKISIWPIVFALGLLCSKMLENPERRAIS